VSESGLKSRAELEKLAAAGYRAFLIGERFMTDPDPAGALKRLVGIGDQGTGIGPTGTASSSGSLTPDPRSPRV
jgi:hypothetical protein